LGFAIAVEDEQYFCIQASLENELVTIWRTALNHQNISAMLGLTTQKKQTYTMTKHYRSLHLVLKFNNIAVGKIII